VHLLVRQCGQPLDGLRKFLKGALSSNVASMNYTEDETHVHLAYILLTKNIAVRDSKVRFCMCVRYTDKPGLVAVAVASAIDRYFSRHNVVKERKKEKKRGVVVGQRDEIIR